MFDLNGKIAIVTGSAMGIGAEIAKELARHGATIAITDINPQAAEATLAAIEADGGIAKAFIHDVTNWDSCFAMAARVEQELGPISILVNNAGVSKRVPLTEMSEGEWDRLMDINLKGQFLTTRAVAPLMLERDYGRIVNLGSVVSKKGYPDFSHYCASKFGVMGFTQSVAAEFARTGVTVNMVCPGIVMTPLHDKIIEEMAQAASTTTEEALREFTSNVPQARAQTPADIAHMVAYLASDYARNMTGGSYHVDGGMVMD